MQAEHDRIRAETQGGHQRDEIDLKTQVECDRKGKECEYMYNSTTSSADGGREG